LPSAKSARHSTTTAKCAVATAFTYHHARQLKRHQVCEEGGLNAMVALCSHFSDDVRAYVTPLLQMFLLCKSLSGLRLLQSSA
jgi:hypothetical protein